MKTQIKPFGIVLQIEFEEKTYFGVIQNDFECFKTFGNSDLDLGSLLLFDEDFNQIKLTPSNRDTMGDLYDRIEEKIEKFVVEEEDEEEMLDVVVCYRDGLPKGFMTEKKFERLVESGKCWWDRTEYIQISRHDWEDERVHIGNIQKFVDSHNNR